jgi:hypothetical protein
VTTEFFSVESELVYDADTDTLSVVTDQFSVSTDGTATKSRGLVQTRVDYRALLRSSATRRTHPRYDATADHHDYPRG